MAILFKETSERSKKKNKAEIKINSFINTRQISFEGVAIKNLKVTCVFDRACYNKDDLFNEDKKNIINEIYNIEPLIDIKLKIAKHLNVKWYFVVYEYSTEHSIVYDFEEVKEVKRFNNFLDLGIWISQYSDKISLSNYEETGLPLIDTIMRKNEYSWPGNMDGLLVLHNQILCVIEYQNTSKKSVLEHDNNDYIKPTKYRKGDARRWLVIKLLSDALKVKTVVIVWSEKENQIAIKPIKKFVQDSYFNVERIIWDTWRTYDINAISEDLFLNIINGR